MKVPSASYGFGRDRRTWRLVVACLAFLVLGAARAAPLKIAFVHENPVGQGGWTLSHELARERLETHFGDAIETQALDGVPPGIDAERALTRLARDGNDLIFATSFGFLNPATRVARRFPGTIFEHASGYRTARNLGTYQIRAYQGRYLSGVAAALVSDSGKLGYVAAFPIPEVIRGLNAFALGARSVNPQAEVVTVWINTWSDAPREREAADLLIAKGVDVITHHTETTAPMQAAEAAGLWSVGYQTDRSAAAPEHHLVSVEHNWFPLYRDTIQAVMDGTWQSDQVWVGVEKGASRLVGWGPRVEPEVRDRIEAIRQRMIEGSLSVFAGPIRDDRGKLRIPAGEVPDDKQLQSMEWVVTGVSGRPPN